MSSEQLINCPHCGAPNYQGVAICARCGAPFQHTPSPIPAPPVVHLPLPVMRGKTWATWVLLGINIVVWLAMTAAGGSTDSQVLFSFGAKYGPAILGGEYWRLFTSMFLHIGLMHLGVNSYALYALGPEAERFYGRARFLAIYLLTGVLSSVTSYLISPTLAAGASGAIFGLVGALGAFFIHERDVLGAPGRRRLNNLASVVVINLIIGFTVPNIDNAAHMGGLLAGFLIGWVLSPEYEVAPPGSAGPARVVDRNSLARRWWVAPAALLLAVGLTLLANVREGRTAAGYQQQGEMHLDKGEWDAAIEEFTEALDRDPRLWVAYLYRAEAYLQVDDLEAALVDFEAVIQAHPAAQYQAIAHTGRGRIYLFYGQPDQALAELDQAVLLDPSEPFARFVRGLIYHEAGQKALAIKDLEAALALGLQDERSVSMAREILEVLRGTAGGS